MPRNAMRLVIAALILAIGAISLVFANRTKTKPESLLSLLPPGRVSASSTAPVLYTGTEATLLQISLDFYLRAGTWTDVEREPENLPQFKNGSESYQTAVLALEDNRGFADKLLLQALDEFIRAGGTIEWADKKTQSGYFPSENGLGGIIRISVDQSRGAMAFAQKELTGDLMKFKANQSPQLDYQYLLDDLWLAMSNRVAVMQRMQHPAMSFRRPPIGLENLYAEPRNATKKTSPEDPCQNCVVFLHAYNRILLDEGLRLDRELRTELLHQAKVANGKDNPKYLGSAYEDLPDDPVFGEYLASLRYSMFVEFTDRLASKLSAVVIAKAAPAYLTKRLRTLVPRATAASVPQGVDTAKIAHDTMTELLTSMTTGNTCQTFTDVSKALERPWTACGLTLTGDADGNDGADGIGGLPFTEKITIRNVDYASGLPSREMSYLSRMHELEINTSLVDPKTFSDSKAGVSVFPVLSKFALRNDKFPTGEIRVENNESLRDYRLSSPTIEGKAPLLTFSNLPNLSTVFVNDVITNYADPDQQPSVLLHPPLSVVFKDGVSRDPAGTKRYDFQRASMESAPDFSGARFNLNSDVVVHLDKNGIASYISIAQMTQKFSGLETSRGALLPRSVTITLSGNPICDPSKNDDLMLEERWRLYQAVELANKERDRKNREDTNYASTKLTPITLVCPAARPALPAACQPLAKADNRQSATVASSTELREYDKWNAALACSLAVSGPKVKGAINANDLAKFFNISSFAMTKTNAISIGNLSGKLMKTITIYDNPILNSAPSNLCSFASSLETLALNNNALTSLPPVSCLTKLALAMDASGNRLTSVPNISAMGSANPGNRGTDPTDGKPMAKFGAGFGNNRLSTFTPPSGSHWGWIALYNNVIRGLLDFRPAPLLGGVILADNFKGPVSSFPTLSEGGRLVSTHFSNAGIFGLPSLDNFIKTSRLTSLKLDGFNPVCLNPGLQKVIDSVIKNRQQVNNLQPLVTGCDTQISQKPISAAIPQRSALAWFGNLFAPKQADSASGVRPVSFSDTFTRSSSSKCSLGRADNGKGGSTNPAEQVYYIPVSSGATISGGVLKNIGKDFGGVQFTGYSGNSCAIKDFVNVPTGLDLMITMNVTVPKDDLGNITAAGPYFRGATYVNAGESVGGPTRNGYWVLLDSRGIVRIDELRTGKYFPTSIPIDGFDPNSAHRLTTTIRGDWLSVMVDYVPVIFQSGTSYTLQVPLPLGYIGTTRLPAGIVFGAPDNRGKIGGQTVDDLIVSAVAPSFCNPVMGFFCGAGYRCSSDPLPGKPWKIYAEDYGTCLRSTNDWTLEDQRIAAAQQKAQAELAAEIAGEAKALKEAQFKDQNDAKKQSEADQSDQANRVRLADASTPRCGDTTIDYYAGEECEPGNLGGLSCSDLDPDTTGTLRCGNDCTLDQSQCVLVPEDARLCTPNVKTIIAQCLPDEICSSFGICTTQTTGESVGVQRATLSASTIEQGKTVIVTLPWNGGPTAVPYQVELLLVDSFGKVAFDASHDPPTPTTQWSGRTTYPRTISIPTTMTPGDYRVRVALSRNGQRLSLTAGTGVLARPDRTYDSVDFTVRTPIMCNEFSQSGCENNAVCIQGSCQLVDVNGGSCAPGVCTDGSLCVSGQCFGISFGSCQGGRGCRSGLICIPPQGTPGSGFNMWHGSCIPSQFVAQKRGEGCNPAVGLVCATALSCSKTRFICESPVPLPPAERPSISSSTTICDPPGTNLNRALLRPTTTCELNLSGQFVPLNLPAISGLQRLKTLSLKAANMSSLPREIGALPNLETLDVSENNLVTLPAEIGNLTRLQTLVLTGNKGFTTFPAEMKNLANLRNLYAAGTALPASERTKLPPNTVLHF